MSKVCVKLGASIKAPVSVTEIPRASPFRISARLPVSQIIGSPARADVWKAIEGRRDLLVLDGRGKSMVPGFVDGHTHALFAGDRRDELRRRLAGASYAEIAAAGGGILSTVAATRTSPRASPSSTIC